MADRMAQRGGFRFLSWLGGHERTVLLALAGIVTGVWLFALLADVPPRTVVAGTPARHLRAVREDELLGGWSKPA